MKKSLISTFIVATFLTASGVAMAGDKDAVQTGTVTTTVTGSSGATIILNDNPQTVTTEDVKSPGVLLTTLGIDASGLNLSSAAGGNIAVEVEGDNYDADSGTWLFKADGNSTPLKALPKSGDGWTRNPNNRTSHNLQGSSENVSTNIQLPIESAEGNNNVTPGNYNMPVTVSFNTW